MILHDAKLPPRKGYVERVNPNTGEHYYHKVYTKVGIVHRKIIIDKSQIFIYPSKAINSYIVLTGGGGSSIFKTDGSAGETVSEKLSLRNGKGYQISIGQAGSSGTSGEPTSFGDLLIALGGQSGTPSNSKPLIVDGIEYGRGETPDAPATSGICIIEYDEVIYE